CGTRPSGRQSASAAANGGSNPGPATTASSTPVSQRPWTAPATCPSTPPTPSRCWNSSSAHTGSRPGADPNLALAAADLPVRTAFRAPACGPAGTPALSPRTPRGPFIEDGKDRAGYAQRPGSPAITAVGEIAAGCIDTERVSISRSRSIGLNRVPCITVVPGATPNDGTNGWTLDVGRRPLSWSPACS